MIRSEDGNRFVDHEITLGKRQAIAAVEHSLIGMKSGGYRKVRVSPHLAYRDQGLPDLIPPDAVLIVELWLRELKHRIVSIMFSSGFPTRAVCIGMFRIPR